MNDKVRHSRRRAQKQLRKRRAHAALISELRRLMRRPTYKNRPRFTLAILRYLRSKYLLDEGKDVKRGPSKRRRSHRDLNARRRFLRITEPADEKLTELAYLGPKALTIRSLRTQSRRLPCFPCPSTAPKLRAIAKQQYAMSANVRVAVDIDLAACGLLRVAAMISTGNRPPPRLFPFPFREERLLYRLETCRLPLI